MYYKPYLGTLLPLVVLPDIPAIGSGWLVTLDVLACLGFLTPLLYVEISGYDMGLIRAEHFTQYEYRYMYEDVYISMYSSRLMEERARHDKGRWMS